MAQYNFWCLTVAGQFFNAMPGLWHPHSGLWKILAIVFSKYFQEIRHTCGLHSLSHHQLENLVCKRNALLDFKFLMSDSAPPYLYL